MKWDNHLRAAIQALDEYDGSLPLSLFLKNYFRRHPQMGSRDRKSMASLLYNYFRLGQACKDISTDKRILAGTFLCSAAPDALLQYFYPSWSDHITRPLAEKIKYLAAILTPFSAAEIFPWRESLSEGIDHTAFCLSFLQQPSLFIRARKGKIKEILSLLQLAGVPFSMYGDGGVALPNSTDVDTIIPDKSWYVVQDWSSQQTAGYFQFSGHNPLSVWDCCAGSGGKSILFHDLYPEIALWVSDVRENILHNLRQRFKMAGITDYQCNVLDLTMRPDKKMKGRSFDVILLDVPCTGSGTWARTPEQLYFFRPGEIAAFQQRQLQIAANVVAYLKKGASLIYITCSVFKEENETVIAALRQKGVQVEETGMIKGYDRQADTMFAARLINS